MTEVNNVTTEPDSWEDFERLKLEPKKIEKKPNASLHHNNNNNNNINSQNPQNVTKSTKNVLSPQTSNVNTTTSPQLKNNQTLNIMTKLRLKNKKRYIIIIIIEIIIKVGNIKNSIKSRIYHPLTRKSLLLRFKNKLKKLKLIIMLI